MRLIVGKRLNEAGEYEPDTFTLEGEGPLRVTEEFLQDADQKHVQLADAGETLRIGPYVFRFLGIASDGVLEFELVNT